MKILTYAAISGMMLAGSLASAQFYKTGAILFSINNGGKAAGINSDGYATWTAGGGLVEIGGSTDAGTATISSDGRYVAGTAVNPFTGLSEASRYDENSGTWTNLGSLGSSSGSNASAGWGMTGDATTVVGNAWVDAGHAHAIRINNGIVTDLGTNLTGHSSRAQAVSADGTLIGGYDEDSGGFWQGAVWKNGVETLLTDGGGNELGEVDAISGDGNWVFGGTDLNGNAYRWNENTGSETFDNPFGLSMTAAGASYDGSVVVGMAGDFFSGYEAWIWRAGFGVQSLESVAAGMNGYDGTQLLGGIGVSADGRYVVGSYANDFGFAGGGFVMDLQPVPEPSSLLALGGLALLAIRRRRGTK